jgi:hypothetical protein
MIDLNPDGPPILCLRVGVSIGKSQAVLEQLADPSFQKVSVYYMTPTIGVAEELCARFNALSMPRGGPRGIVFRGRGQDHDSGEPMCRKKDLAEKVARLGGNVKNVLCAHEGEACPYHLKSGGTCHYVAQMEDTGPGVRFMTHPYLFLQKPEAVPGPSLVVIDESFFQASLRGTSERSRKIEADDLRATRWVPRRDGSGQDEPATADLTALSERAAKVVEAGDLSPAAFTAAGFTAKDADTAYALERRCITDEGLTD